MKWAIEQAPPMPAQLVATLAGLANHADAKGRGAYPSLPKLAAYTCKAERSVRRDLRQLEDLGLIRPGDPRKVAHLPSDRRPEVYDLAMETTVPGGRAGSDGRTRASARTLASARARGGKKKASSPAYRADVDVRGDADVRADVDVTNGGTWTSQRGDAHVTNGGTPTSAKPSVEPPENRQMNQGGARVGTNSAPPDHPARPDGHPAPIDDSGFALTDPMRRWATATFGTTLDIDYETAQFLDHHRAEAGSRRNWAAEWQKWMRRSAKWASERGATSVQGAFLMPLPGGGNPRSTTDQRVAAGLAIAAELRALEEGHSA